MRARHSGGHRHSLSVSAAASLLVVVFATMLPTSAVTAADSNLTSDQVAAEIVRVQGIADDTATRWAEAQLRSDELAAELTVAETRLAEATAQHSQLETDLTEIALSRFTSAPAVR